MLDAKLRIGENQRRQAVDDELPQVVVLERDAVLLYQDGQWSGSQRLVRDLPAKSL